MRKVPAARQRPLVSVRGPNDAKAAVAGGAHIIDAEYPASALGTVHPGNIRRIRSATPSHLSVSTNIGEVQNVWSTAAQAALGVALAGADIIKVGLGGLPPAKATRLMGDIARQMRFFFRKPAKALIVTLFADKKFRRVCDPVRHGAEIASKTKVAGVLIDTFSKRRGHALLDLMDLSEIKGFARSCHDAGVEAWIAGSVKQDQMPDLWNTGGDVICIRGAACQGGEGSSSPASRRTPAKSGTSSGRLGRIMRQVAHLSSPSDHGGSIVSASTKVFCEGIGVARRDDVHDCPIPGHGKTKIVSFDPKVFADGRSVARVGDKAGCGAAISAGCVRVFSG